MKLRNIGSHTNELHTGKAIVLFSYETPVAAVVNGTNYRTDKRYSVTTSRHINQWLNGMKAETKPQTYFDNLVA